MKQSVWLNLICFWFKQTENVQTKNEKKKIKNGNYEESNKIEITNEMISVFFSCFFFNVE